jgi:hypothetical protein
MNPGAPIELFWDRGPDREELDDARGGSPDNLAIRLQHGAQDVFLRFGDSREHYVTRR